MVLFSILLVPLHAPTSSPLPASSIIRSIHLSASPAHRLNRPSLIRNDLSIQI